MDMSFGIQSLMSEYIIKNKDSLKPGMVDVPIEIDDKVFIFIFLVNYNYMKKKYLSEKI